MVLISSLVTCFEVTSISPGHEYLQRDTQGDLDNFKVFLYFDKAWSILDI